MRKTTTIIALAAAVTAVTVTAAQAAPPANPAKAGVGAELAAVRDGTAAFHRLDAALDAGYTAFAIPPEVGGHPTDGLGLVGDPTCFDGAAGGMGVHYVKGIDGTLDPSQPEALVYAVTDEGLQLVAVEFIVPEELVDPMAPPMLFGRHLHHHPYLPVYVLHAWVWKNNPAGMFEDLNPSVAPCP